MLGFKRVTDMEFELDEYLGLPTDMDMEEEDMYEMKGGAGAYTIIAKSMMAKPEFSIDEIKKKEIIIVNELSPNEPKDITSIMDISGVNIPIAITGPAVQAIANEIADGTEGSDAFKTFVMPKLFQIGTEESEPGATPLNQIRQFAFFNFIHGIHAEILLGDSGSDKIPAFDAEIIEKYTWFGNALNDMLLDKSAKAGNDILPGFTKESVLSKWNEIMDVKPSLESFDKLVELFMKPVDLRKLLEEEAEETEETEEAEETEEVEEAEETEEAKEAEEKNNLEVAADNVANNAITNLEGEQLKKGGYYTEPKTTEEYFMDFSERVA